MKKSNKKILSRRGFSIVEVVVALAVVTIITAAMFPLLNSGTKLQEQSMRTFESANIAENAIECFRFAGGQNNVMFTNSLKTALGLSLDEQIPVVEINGKSYYCIDKGYYVVAINIANNTINIYVVENKEAIGNIEEGKYIDNYSYTIYK